MSMTKEGITGVWSFNAPYEEDLSRDTQIWFLPDGCGSITHWGIEVLRFSWYLPDDGAEAIVMGRLVTPDGKPVRERFLHEECCITDQSLPRGQFKVLAFKHFSVPFGMSKFGKLTERDCRSTPAE